MAENCTHDCSTCSAGCDHREHPKKADLLEPCNPASSVKKVIAVVSGKGGVGKSLVTASLACAMARQGRKVGVLDADITGPSIPHAFGIHEKATGSELGIDPAVSKNGVKVMSLNLLTMEETDPVVWRGPVIAGTVKQFWTDVVWGDVDYLFVDMPPGTGDVPLTVFQSLPVDGIIIVTSPQELVSMIVQKAVNMAKMMNIPVLGLVENMAYVQCPHCDEKIYPYGQGNTAKAAMEAGLPLMAQLPINSKLAGACDKGMLELFEGDWLSASADMVEKL